MNEIEEIKAMQVCFEKSSNILKSIIKLLEELEKEENKEKAQKIAEKIEEKQAMFMVQLLKIDKFNSK